MEDQGEGALLRLALGCLERILMLEVLEVLPGGPWEALLVCCRVALVGNSLLLDLLLLLASFQA